MLHFGKLESKSLWSRPAASCSARCAGSTTASSPCWLVPHRPPCAKNAWVPSSSTSVSAAQASCPLTQLRCGVALSPEGSSPASEQVHFFRSRSSVRLRCGHTRQLFLHTSAGAFPLGASSQTKNGSDKEKSTKKSTNFADNVWERGVM